MTIQQLISSIVEKNINAGIEVNAPATIEDISKFETQIGFSLPEEFVTFYTICNGFGCLTDIFNIIPLQETLQHPEDYGKDWFYFAEYMIFSDMWGLRITDTGKYEIFNGSNPTLTLTSSLVDFLSRFLRGRVFESGGLYEWQDGLKSKCS